ncbi:MAG: hypothetical protein IJ611_03095 [Bacteroidales bacterium]|nr:hypothetical protein [Bacteroidales bacterium]
MSSSRTQSIILLHTAVFLAGWTGILGMREVNFSFWIGIALIVVSVLVQTYRIGGRGR